MNLTKSRHALVFSLEFRLRTPLMLMTGEGDEISDNTIEKTPDGMLHINGYVWSSLLRRALLRLNDGKAIAEQIGKYEATKGVSALWCESSLEVLPQCDRRPGIVISRRWGSTAKGLLYSEENVPSGLPIFLKFIWFPEEKPEKIFDPVKEAADIRDRLTQAFWVIDQGIENIGAGWSYGFGRLSFKEGRSWLLDLSKSEDRARLFDFQASGKESQLQQITLPQNITGICMPWKKFILHFTVSPGQMLAIHTRHPQLDADILDVKAPDSFVFRSLTYNAEQKIIESSITIPGKAVRQALFSTQIERRLRSKGLLACDISSSESPCNRPNRSAPCDCRRCLWFGSTDCSGILAVLDAHVNGPATEVVHRLAICEHSHQNIPQKLFSGEYLTSGSFDMEVILDQSRPDSYADVLESYLKSLLNEMKPGNGPDGWHRIGATSTCTGQLQLKELKETFYGGV